MKYHNILLEVGYLNATIKSDFNMESYIKYLDKVVE